MPDEEFERQRLEWEEYATKELLSGRCPDSGEDLRPVMDWWNRRVLMCAVCDCFGLPLVMSDFDPEKLPPTFDDGSLDW